MLSTFKSSTASGKLIIVAGYAPGTGKTHFACSLLSNKRKFGSDIVIGYLNRQRPELAEILNGTESFRPSIDRPITHNEALLDVSAIKRRKPDIVFIDELALPNAYDPPHFMYEGILDLVHYGIDVYTTVNLQKFEKINIACSKKTRLKQKTVIPDSVLLEADTIYFLNQSPSVISRRYLSGQLFSKKQMERDFLRRYMDINTLTLNHDICLSIIKEYKNVQIIEY